jgi:hypothetical protein
MAKRITVLSFYNRISVCYGLLPILESEWSRICDFTQSLKYCLERDRNQVLIIVRFFSRNGAGKVEALRRLRDRYETIVWFDDGDGAACTSFEVLPLVDLYWKKQLLRDRSHYLRRLYGRQLYTDYYHERFGVTDDRPYLREPAKSLQELDKLRLTWNIGVGCYPLDRNRQRLGVALARILGKPGLRLGLRLQIRHPPVLGGLDKEPTVFARFGRIAGRPSVNFQREFVTKVLGQTEGLKALVGRVPKSQYDKEMANAAATVSPFGWGEICFRDFEAIFARSVLVKPSMDHLETWPNVYVPGQTYVPVAWDCTDLAERAADVVGNPARRREMTENAIETLQSARANVDERVDLRFQELVA